MSRMPQCQCHLRFRNPHTLLTSEINLDVGFGTAATSTRHRDRSDRYASRPPFVTPGIKKPGSVHSSWHVASSSQRAIISTVRQTKRTICNASSGSARRRRARTHVKSTSSDDHAAIDAGTSFDSRVLHRIWTTNDLSECAQRIDAFSDGLYQPDDVSPCAAHDLASSPEAFERLRGSSTTSRRCDACVRTDAIRIPWTSKHCQLP